MPPADWAGIKKNFLSSIPTTLIISNNDLKDITKKVKSLEEFGLLIKRAMKQLKMKQNNRKADICC